MGLSRYLWLLQFKKLWLSRADLLGDPWEIPLTNEHIEFLRKRRPLNALGAMEHETFDKRNERIIKNWRRATFVNCWCCSENESHALWRVYCGANEGVAIQTTFGKLRSSVTDFDVFPVKYGLPETVSVTPTWQELVATKRPMFEYEHEVRVVGRKGNQLMHLPDDAPGFGLEWDPERRLEAVCVHPETDSAFMDTVLAATAHYAPSLRERVIWSKMRDRLPF